MEGPSSPSFFSYFNPCETEKHPRWEHRKHIYPSWKRITIIALSVIAAIVLPYFGGLALYRLLAHKWGGVLSNEGAARWMAEQRARESAESPKSKESPKAEAPAFDTIAVARDFAELVDRSVQFHAEVCPSPLGLKAPNQVAQIAGTSLVKAAAILRCADSTHIFMATKTRSFISAFLEDKKAKGSAVERRVYADMTEDQFIRRLITQRPMVYYCAGRTYPGLEDRETYRLRGKANKGEQADAQVVDRFTLIGTDQESAPFVLEDYLSVEERKLARYISFGGFTPFINKGDRQNGGVPGGPGTFLPEAFYANQVGIRLEGIYFKPYGDPQEMVIPHSPTDHPGRPRPNHFWEQLFGLTLYDSYEEAVAALGKKEAERRYLKLPGADKPNQPPGPLYLDRDLYCIAMRLILEPFLDDVNATAAARGRGARVHEVGLGLGAWSVHSKQKECYFEVYAEILARKSYPHIAIVDFSYFDAVPAATQARWESSASPFQGSIQRTNPSLQIRCSLRNPADPLPPEEEGLDVYGKYAGDSFSYPGNEWHNGARAGTGEPAAAGCSAVTELHNPHINAGFTSRIAVWA